ncbi:putative glycerophosphoryl diester phosphodiesterase yhdW [Waddlia chondrophila 2032/99]|uniref:Putative glycerophosphoryl diester phosphodiesterase n=2 Tax=Waddlia chondrophila TaxID=71667 RepID=D6YT63_WADCW|nr:glycerophosphodiester phosphodiesterase family protein [Waddlia chondrophila]ADI39258.1 putative glycerophosphoryl diester phosphodiesterase [Waddlia chondrophila WSU 86-1044]CCB91648.1 putative glycerophosphoryl diester phosphodiesterase yhdW [Waddlia chondrophila 2032/99]
MKILLVFLIFISSLLAAKDIAIIAHRGNSKEAPENTISAFLSAGRVEADFVECDVHLTKDGIPVVVHDRFLCRTINSHYPIAIETLTLDELNSYDAGSWFSQKFEGQRIPTLSNLLNTELGRTGIMLEIKEGSAPPNILAKKVVEAVNKEPRRTVIIGSQSAKILEEVRKLSPRQPIIAIIEDIHKIKPHRENRPNFYALHSSIVSSELVRVVHDEQRLVWVWTVDNPDKARHYAEMNVDGIITNSPREMRHAGISTLN